MANAELTQAHELAAVPNQVQFTASPVPVGLISVDDVVILQVQPADVTRYRYVWTIDSGAGYLHNPDQGPEARWFTAGVEPNEYKATVAITFRLPSPGDATIIPPAPLTISVVPRVALKVDVPPITTATTLRRTVASPTSDLPLWVVIRKSCEALSFNNYNRFIDFVLCGKPLPIRDLDQYELERIRDKKTPEVQALSEKRFLPFHDVDAYRLLKAATEAFVMVNCAVALNSFDFAKLRFEDINNLITRTGANLDAGDLRTFWLEYLKDVNGQTDAVLPYLALIKEKFRDAELIEGIFKDGDFGVVEENRKLCSGILRNKLTNPCLLELIWSYWHEEGMLVQTTNTIGLRFQNIRASNNGRDPLANFETDPLRPLNNLLWGYIQDEQHRLSVVRRAYEYDHHYGMSLYGKALPKFQPADSRSKFLEAFHNLLHLASIFFKEDDDTTMIADGFSILNALKEVHLLLSEGAHNQFGDLPSTTRIEMMIQQWLLARPEFREFLPTRIMVAYPEPWMDRVDAMKKLQGWTDTSILHFRNLAIFGEEILLSARYGNWSDVNEPTQAALWARFWRSEIQSYIHAYRAVTSVDLTTDVTDVQEATQRFLPPSVHLRTRLERQMQKV